MPDVNDPTKDLDTKILKTIEKFVGTTDMTTLNQEKIDDIYDGLFFSFLAVIRSTTETPNEAYAIAGMIHRRMHIGIEQMAEGHECIRCGGDINKEESDDDRRNTH